MVISKLTPTDLGETTVNHPIPQSGAEGRQGYDSSYSIRSHVRMDYLYVYTSTFHYFQIEKAQGCWRILDASVTTPLRRLFVTTEDALQNGRLKTQRLGPYFPSPITTGYSCKRNLVNTTIKVNSEMIHAGRCATITDVKKGSNQWSFTVTVGMGNYREL